MQFNPKYHVDIKNLVEEIVKKANDTAEKNNIPSVYDVRIKDGTYRSNVVLKETKKLKPFKTIVFTVSDLETREQIILFSADYIIKNSADLLTSNYRKALYKELLYSCLLTFAITSENNVKKQRAEKAIERAKATEHPVTPDEAFKSEESIVENMK